MRNTKRRSGRRSTVGGLAALVPTVMPPVVLGLGLCLGLGVAAAGPGDAAEASSGATAAALSQAKHELIVRSDFPKGWSAQGAVTTDAGGGSNSFPGQDQLAGCLGVSPSLIELNTPTAASPTFQSSDSRLYVSQNLSIFPSTKVARQASKALSGSKVPACMTALFQGPGKSQLETAIGHGITVGTVSVAAAKRSVLGSHSNGFVISFPAITQGVSIPSTITIISSIRGRVGSQLTISSVGAAFPASLEKHLVAVAYSRS